MWDFAGDGWVHRLVLNESDSPSEAQEWDQSPGSGTEEGAQTAEGHLRGSLRGASFSVSGRSMTSHSINNRGLNSDEHRLKMVEVPDPYSRAAHRSRVMPLTGGQEELAVNR